MSDLGYEVPRTQEDARKVLLRIAADDTFREEHPLIEALCDEEDLRGIVDLAWRFQFAEDRMAFKRAMRELEQHIATKAHEAEA